MKSKALSGRYFPVNVSKYLGDPTDVIYRSSWERRVMTYLDKHPDVLSWNSEEVVIPYISPVDNRRHRYFPDFKATIKTKSGDVVTYILEVKPKKETMEPKKRKKVTERYLEEVETWAVNQAKWQSANEYCIQNGYKFKLLTEDDLGIR